MTIPVPSASGPRILRLVLLALASLALALSLTSVAHAATLNVVFDNTSPGASTGSAPFDADDAPGNDSSATNHVVRAHDTITYHWALSANGGTSPNTTVTQVLPADMEWVNLPAYCLTGAGVDPPSSLSADKRTIVCNTGPQGSSAVDLYPTARVLGASNGTTLTTEITVSSSDPGTSAVTSAPITDTVSAAPRVNLQKRNYYSYNGSHNGVDGVFLSYSLSLVVNGEGGKGLRGAETLAQPFTLTDDISGYLPGAVFIGLAGVSGGSSVPWSYGGLGAGNGVPNSGAWSGVQAAPGGNVAITVTGADLSGTTTPTTSSNGGVLPADDKYLATQVIDFFIPFDNIPGNEPMPFENVVRDFDPNSVTGQSNFGPGQEPLEDNVVEGQYLKPQGEGGLGKYYRSVDTPNELLTSASSYNSGDGLLFPGQTFYGLHDWGARNGEARTYHRPVLCDNFDTSSVALSTENLPAGAGGKPAWIDSTPAGLWVVEYAVTGVRGATDASWDAPTGARNQPCDDADADAQGWVTDPTTLSGGLDSVTSVRMRATTDATGITYQIPRLLVNYKVRITDKYTGDPITVGRKIANFIQFGEDGDNDGTRTWRTNTYDPMVNNNVLGAVATIAGGVVRIEKETDAPGQVSALSGGTVKYTLQPSATAPIPSGGSSSGFVMHDLKIVDTIPKNMTYVDGSSNRTPASVVVNGDGTTTVTWNLGDAPVNGTLPQVTYETRVKLSAPNGAQEVNTAVISSVDDPSPQNARTDTYTIRVDKVFGIVVAKSTATPWIEPLDQAIFDLEYVNNAADSVSSLDLIDVLPYNGDDRGNDSAFHGSVKVRSVTPDDAGDVVSYTSRAAGQVSNNPNDASNAPAGATKWCTTVQLGTSGCPENVAAATAVRVTRTGTIPSGEGGNVRIVLDTVGNASGDRYVNDAGLAAGGVTLPAFANPVEVQVVASNLGDFVWEDRNSNGIQDAGEPGIPGVTVTLTGTDKDDNPVDRSVTTDANGRYTFANEDGGFTLRSGEYRLTFAKAGYGFTTQGAGSDTEKDSDADQVTGRTGAITIASPIPGRANQQDLSYDAGLVKLPDPPVVPPTEPPAVPPVVPPGVPPLVPSTPPTQISPDGVVKKHALSIVKRANRKSVRPGQRVVYTLKVTASRSGNEDAVNEQLCDTLPKGLTLVDMAGGKLRNGKLCWTIKRLAPGKSFTKYFTVRVDRDVPAGRIVNTATVSDQGKKRTAKRTVQVMKTQVKQAATSYVTG
ncbi:MAG: SdrD B-like domain-containing protein [Patulibacter sp.]